MAPYTFSPQQFELSSVVLCSKTCAPSVPLSDSLMVEQRLFTHPEPSVRCKSLLMLAMSSSSHSTLLWLPMQRSPTLLSRARSCKSTLAIFFPR